MIKNAALIKNNIVQNIVVVEEDDLTSLNYFINDGFEVVIDHNNMARIGGNYDGNIFSSPEPIVPEPIVPTELYISGIEFLRSFNMEQRITIRELSKTDAIMNDFMFLLDATISTGGKINLLDPDTVAGVEYIAQQLAAINIIIDIDYILKR